MRVPNTVVIDGQLVGLCYVFAKKYIFDPHADKASMSL